MSWFPEHQRCSHNSRNNAKCYSFTLERKWAFCSDPLFLAIDARVGNQSLPVRTDAIQSSSSWWTILEIVPIVNRRSVVNGVNFVYFGSERVTRCVLPGELLCQESVTLRYSKQTHVGVHGSTRTLTNAAKMEMFDVQIVRSAFVGSFRCSFFFF